MGSENQSRTNCIGGFTNTTVAIEGQLKGYRSRYNNLIQKSALLGSARILRKVLEM